MGDRRPDTAGGGPWLRLAAVAATSALGTAAARQVLARYRAAAGRGPGPRVPEPAGPPGTADRTGEGTLPGEQAGTPEGAEARYAAEIVEEGSTVRSADGTTPPAAGWVAGPTEHPAARSRAFAVHPGERSPSHPAAGESSRVVLYERRITPRVPFERVGLVEWRGARHELGLTNLSEGGVGGTLNGPAARSLSGLRLREPVVLSLPGPDGDLRLPARLAWRRGLGRDRGVEVGFQFTALDPAQRDGVRRLATGTSTVDGSANPPRDPGDFRRH